MNVVTIVKFGGSVITHKNVSPPKVNSEVLSRIIGEIGIHHQGLVLVLGGGAHGHQPAHSFGYGSSSTPRESLLSGIPVIRRNMTNLSETVNREFRLAGFPAVVISPFMFVTMTNGEILSFPTLVFSNAIDAGISVITHGDVCFDSICGASILSGDSIVVHLVRELGAKRVLVGTNVDGVFDSDPMTNPDARVIPLINSENQDEVMAVTGPSESTDVTGGMNRKLSELLSIAGLNREIVIFNLLVPDRLKALLNREPVLCTRISV